MVKLSLAGAAAVAITAAMFAPSLGARVQGGSQFEYMRVSNHYSGLGESSVLRACVAAVNAWDCRDFPAATGVDPAATMLSTLGNEGWELVSVVPGEISGSPSVSMLFKRQR